MEDLTRTQYIQLVPEELQESTTVKNVLSSVYAALTEKGYNPVNQIVGYMRVVSCSTFSLRLCTSLVISV